MQDNSSRQVVTEVSPRKRRSDSERPVPKKSRAWITQSSVPAAEHHASRPAILAAPPQIEEFHPHPLLRSGHVQTLFGALVVGKLAEYNATPRVIPLSDGESLVVHEERHESLPATAPVLLLVHGLGGDHSSPYLRRMARGLSDCGVRTWRLDMRGCGAGMSLAYRPAHAGSSHDLAAAVAAAQQAFPQAPIAVAAFSLGGNILLKMLGEEAAGMGEGKVDLSRLNLAIAVAPPSDLRACSRNMDRFSRKIYTRYYLRVLARQVRLRAHHWDIWRNIRPSAPLKSIRQFDDTYTSPLAGFSHTDEYYEKCSSAPWFEKITVPTRLLIDRDDPIIPVASLENIQTSSMVTKQFTRHGGHLGYVGRRPGSPGITRWMDQWVINQVKELHSVTN